MKKENPAKWLAYAYDSGPLYRVIRQGWKRPLDSSFSQTTANRRWNTPDFPALYCCSSPKVARAVTLDLFRFTGIQIEDLRPDLHPQLVEINWTGSVVDMATSKGIRAAGFSSNYPEGASLPETQKAATKWHKNGQEGVICRSASLHRLHFSDWSGQPERWSEIAIFPQRAKRAPRLVRRIFGLGWMNV